MKCPICKDRLARDIEQCPKASCQKQELVARDVNRTLDRVFSHYPIGHHFRAGDRHIYAQVTYSFWLRGQ